MRGPNIPTTASAAGWVVQLCTPQAEEKSSFKFFNVAIPDADMAAARIRNQTGATEMDLVYAVRPLSAGELATMRLEAGEAKPA